jgi:hypothetical protein
MVVGQADRIDVESKVIVEAASAETYETTSLTQSP